MTAAAIARLIILASVLTPTIALAAPAVNSTPAETGVTGLVTAITGLVTAIAAGVAALRATRRAKQADAKAVGATTRAEQADARAAIAQGWADRHANAHSDGVVLLLSYPGARTSCRGLLEVNGWRVAACSVSQGELNDGLLLPGPHTIADVCAADAIVVEGLDPDRVEHLAGMREFRDNIRAGASVVLHTAGNNVRYDLARWGECDQGTTTPVTSEAAVRASLARREATAKRQGVRPGRLAETRQALIGADATIH